MLLLPLLFLLTLEVRISSASRAERISEDQARDALESLNGENPALNLNFDFDVDCSMNYDKICYDYCMYYCVMDKSTSASMESCQNQLPIACTAVWGGLKIFSFTQQKVDRSWHTIDANETQTWQMDLKQIRERVKDIEIDNVDSFEVYMGIPPTPESVDFVPVGGTESAFHELEAEGHLCGLHPNATSAMTWPFQAYGPDNVLKEFAGLSEIRGLQASSPYVSKFGWKLFQQHVGHWENELLKRFYIFPLTNKLLTLPENQGDSALMLLTDYAACAMGKSDRRVLFAVWGKVVQGRVHGPGGTRKHGPLLAAMDEWGFPLPRPSESCLEKIKDCFTCQNRTSLSGAPCQWCMTAQGQSCQVDCEDSFNTQLPCDEGALLGGLSIPLLALSLPVFFVF